MAKSETIREQMLAGIAFTEMTMGDIDFYARIDKLITDIKEADQVNAISNPSYSHLIVLLSQLSRFNIGDKKGAIIYFIADSFDGDREIANKVSDFLQMYPSREK